MLAVEQQGVLADSNEFRGPQTGTWTLTKENSMKKSFALVMALSSTFCLAAQDAGTAVEGSVKKIDAGTKTVVVKATDGTEHTFHYAGDLTVKGGKDAAKGGEDSLHGLKEGSHVAVHYTAKGGEETAHEIDNIGDDGLKATKGTVSSMDKAGRKIAVKTEDGTVQTFDMTGHVVKDSGKGVANAADKSGKVTVYYTEEAGKKVAHFIKAF
jgi:hypothetical protein